MKKQLSLAAAFLFVLTGIAGCKKEGLDKFKTDINRTVADFKSRTRFWT